MNEIQKMLVKAYAESHPGKEAARFALRMIGMDSETLEDGGPGSGFHGHAGIPGHRGGSAKGSGYSMRVGRPAEAAEHKAVTARSFVGRLAKAKSSQNVRDAWRVDSYRTAKDFQSENVRTYATKGGSTFAIKPDGDIISVCKNANGDKGLNARDLMAAAVANGGDHLDSFSGNWAFYTKCGFEVVARCKFDPEYAPPGWDPARDKKEDVLFMRYVGEGKSRDKSMTAMKNRIPYSASYDDAAAVLEREMKKGRGQ